jgi:hypothetical protein
MIFIIFAWVFWFLSCFNLGFFVLEKLFREEHKKIDFFYNFWFGLFFLIVILQFVSLFYPLNDKVLIGFVIIDFLLLALNIKSIKINPKLILKNFFQHIDIKKILIFGFLALLIALLANLPVSWYDTLLYHLNSVKWLTDYGTVRGLANLYFPLGYNNDTFILAAIMNNSIFANSSSHIMNSFLFAVFSFQIISFLFKKQKNKLAYIFGFFSLLILSTFANQINSLSTDLSLAVFFLLFNFYVITFDREDVALSIPILILAAASKFSSFVVLALFSIYILIVLKKKILVKKNIYILLSSLVFFAGFITRNLILSGWAFYPLKLFGFNFAWQVPSAQIKIINDGLTAWSRSPGPGYMSSLGLGFWGWFVPWFNTNKSNPLMFYSFMIISLLFVYFFLRSKLKKQFDFTHGISKIDFLIFANLATLLYAFITAPDPRYMGIYILVTVALILSVLLIDIVKPDRTNFVMVLIFIFFISSNLFKEIDFGGKKFNIQKDESPQVQWIQMSYPDQSFYVLVPVNDDRCGNSELPCSPQAYGFKMFQSGNVKTGFYLSQGLAK